MIKTFEEYSNSLYSKIYYSEYNIIYNIDTIRSEFTKSEISMIENITNKFNMGVLLSSLSTSISICNKKDTSDFNTLVSVDKVDDDWFYVCDADYDYYKCDQIEGLLECLSNILIGKIVIMNNLNESKSYYEVESSGIIDNKLDIILEKELYQIVNHLEKLGIDNTNYQSKGRKLYELRFNMKGYTKFYRNVILKLSDEWFILFMYPNKYYKCDQVGGLLECLNEVLSLEYNESTYYRVYNNVFPELSLNNQFSRIEVLSLEKICRINNKDIHFLPSLCVAIIFDKNLSISTYRIDISKSKDDWFIIDSRMNDKSYRCDQIDGVLDCLVGEYSFEHLDVNESIKIFEDLKNIDGYQKISSDHDYQFDLKYKYEKFSDEEYSRIRNEFSSSAKINKDKVQIIIGYEDYYIIITKYEDEWFIVTFGVPVNSYSPICDYYLCDQFYNLVRCLEGILFKYIKESKDEYFHELKFHPAMDSVMPLYDVVRLRGLREYLVDRYGDKWIFLGFF